MASHFGYFAVLACLLGQIVALNQGFGRKKEFVPFIRGDVKYVQCEMCQRTAKHVHRLFSDIRTSRPKWKPLKEHEIIEQLELMCNTEKEEGDWIAKLDIVHDKDELRVVEMGMVGDCRRECATLAKVCKDVTGEIDIDLSELIFTAASRADILQAMCYDLTDACSSKPGKFTGERPDGEDFQPLDESTLKLKRTMDTMTAQGMSGDLMSRDRVMEQMEEYREMMEDYDIDMDELLNKMSSAQAGNSGDEQATAEDDAPADELRR